MLQLPIALSSLVTCNEKTKEKKNVTKSKESKELRERSFSPTTNFLVGNYGLKRAESWDDMPSMFSEVGEIQVCLYIVLLVIGIVERLMRQGGARG